MDKRNIADILALTPMQEGMLFHYLKDPESDLYFEQLSLYISGEINIPFFEQTWNWVIKSNEMLRTLFHWEDVKNPVQIVLKKFTLKPAYVNLSDRETGEKKKVLKEIKTNDRKNKFDLREVPFRVTLCKLEEYQYEVIISNHHILYDGWSNGIILKEFFKAYNNLSDGKGLVKPVKAKFKEFVRWIQSQDTRKQEEYWKEYLQGFNNRTGCPVKKSKRKEIKSTGNYHIKLPGEMKGKLEGFVKSRNITIATLLYSVWGILLQKYNFSNDVIFDATVSGRRAKINGIEDIVGLFINTLPLRVNTHPNEKISGFLSRTYLMLQRWEEFENSSLVNINEYHEKCHRKNLFDSVLVIENYPLVRILLQENSTLSVKSFSISGITQYDLTIIITVFDDIEFAVNYDKDLFEEAVISILADHFIRILGEVVNNPGKSVEEIKVLSDEEREAFVEQIRSAREAEPAVEVDYTAPVNEVEEKLVEIWSAVLNIDRQVIGIDNNFFDYRAHSLNASLLATAIHKEFQVKMPLTEIFREPTIRELAAFINKKSGNDQQQYQSIEPTEKKEYYTPSSAQVRFYMLHRLDPENTVYNGTTAVTVEGPLYKNKAEWCFNRLIHRHESLRTSFVEIQGHPVQKVHKDVHFLMEYKDIPGGEAKVNVFVRPFDLSGTPLMRAGLLKIEEHRYILVVDMHHIITDGVSEVIIINEFTALYRGNSLPPLRIQYKDFSQWQYSHLESGKLNHQESFWLHHLSAPLPVLRMPLDYPRPVVLSFEGDTVHARVGKPVFHRLNALMKSTGTTLFMVLLSLYNILLNKYTGQQDIVIGSAIAGRDHADLAYMVGLLVETTAFRNHPAGNKSFLEFLKQVKKNTIRVFENQGYPFRELTKKLDIPIGAGRNPLFDAMLTVQNYGLTALEIEGLTFTPYPIEKKLSKLDLSLEIWENPEGIELELEYSTRLYKRETMERFLHHFTNIMDTVVEYPTIRLSDIEMLSTGERSGMLQPVNNGKLEAEFEF